jgi:hypothetical protein
MLKLIRFRRARALIAAIALTSQACYSYLPVTAQTTPKAGERVRIVLTPEGTTEMARYLGPNVTVAEGDLTSTQGDGTLVVAVDFVQMSNGIRQPWSGEGVVSFPPQFRTQLQSRVFQKGRSFAGGVALVAALVGTAIIAIKSGGAKGGGDNGGPPPT